MLSKTTALLGAALCASVGEYAAASTVSAVYPYTPVVFWSDRATFNAKNAYVGAVLNEKDTVSVLNSVLARDAKQDAHSVLSQSSSTASRAEALCVFVRESLRSTDLADFDEKSFVQSAVEDSVSSVVIPHTTRSQSLVSTLKASSPVVVSIDDIQTWIASADGKKLLSNDQADLVLINVPETYTLAAADAKIQAAAKALVGATNGLVDFALTGDDAAPVVAKKDPYARRRLASGTTSVSATDIICDAGYLVGISSTGKAFCFSHYVRMTPEVLTALLFGFFFIFISYVGLSVLNAIQTPLRYPLHGPPKGKEF